MVPPGDEAKQVSCPICKETLKSEFLEDDEDWVWKNAVMKDDRVRLSSTSVESDVLTRPPQQVYHATCHAEAVASTNNLAARLRNEIAAGSRSGTPDAQSARSTPPKAVSTTVKSSLSPSPQSKVTGTKRKIENDDPNLPSEANGSPPAKKLAIESES